jgi:hypothetical protein
MATLVFRKREHKQQNWGSSDLNTLQRPIHQVIDLLQSNVVSEPNRARRRTGPAPHAASYPTVPSPMPLSNPDSNCNCMVCSNDCTWYLTPRLTLTRDNLTFH